MCASPLPRPGRSYVVSVQEASSSNTCSPEHTTLPQTALTHTTGKQSVGTMLPVSTNEDPKAPGEGCGVA